MVIVSPELLDQHIKTSPLLEKAVKILENDDEVVELLKMSNVMAVTRLRYNDHGKVHARIVAGAALELLELLMRRGIKPSSLIVNTARSVDEAKLIVLLAAYLHDIGNSIHRVNHELLGALLAKDILNRLLPEILGPIHRRHMYALRQEILHAIYATDYNVDCLTIESGVVKIADGLDMAKGRARVPYRLGKMDMHAVSALSIECVEIEQGERPIKIVVHMNDIAGLYQLEEVLEPKIRTSGVLSEFIEVYVSTPTRSLKYYPKEHYTPQHIESHSSF